MPKPKSQLYALGIVAHPDDETFLFAGTSLEFAKQAKKMGVVCATKGEKGADRLNRDLTKPQMAAERVAELKKAAKIIKISKLDFFSYPDGGLDKVNFAELTRKLIKKIDQYKPVIILTFGKEGISGHRDHTVIGNAATVAANAAKYKPKEIWLASMPKSKIKEFNTHLNKRKVHHAHFHPTLLKGVPDKQLKNVDITKYSKIKMTAIKTHKSQYMPGLIMDSFLTNEYFQIVQIKP